MPSKKQFLTEHYAGDPEQGLKHLTLGSLDLTFRLNMISAATLHAMKNPATAIDALVEAVHSSVIQWNLQDDDDGPIIPLTREGIAGVEVVILQFIFDAMLNEVSLGETQGMNSQKPTS